MRVVAAARARCRSGRRAAHRAPAVGGGCPLTAGASEGGGATGAPPSGCYASACPRGERVARQRASPFGALHTVRRRLPLILSLERGGRGLTRKPPQPRGYLHGTGGKNGRRGAAARLLLAGETPPQCGAPLGAACCCSTTPSASPTATAAPPLGGMLVVRGGRARPRATTIYPC